MTKELFDQLVEEIRMESLDTLVQKNAKYAQGDDRLHNFKAGADIGGGTAAQACWGYLTKHLVALRDMVERNDFSDREDFLEKCKDSINYIVFLWCIGNEERLGLLYKEHFAELYAEEVGPNEDVPGPESGL